MGLTDHSLLWIQRKYYSEKLQQLIGFPPMVLSFDRQRCDALTKTSFLFSSRCWLTHFFISELTIPFHSIYDVMKSYPSWNLRILDGTDGMYQSRAQHNDPEYIRFWDRVVNKPKETTYKTIEEGLDLLITGNSKSFITLALKTNGFEMQTD